MQTYELILKSDVSKSFKCQKAADSLDIDVEKKSIHHIKIDADITSKFNVGLIVGASGSGKTTLVQKIYGKDCFYTDIDEDLPIIDQFPKSMSYDECASILSGIGLTAVPCWIRPVKTLSNGQKFRALCALAMVSEKEIVLIDEWTSVVDRTVAKAMSHCVQKFARKYNKTIILCSCHYDVTEWLNPCWVIDCNKQSYQDRRSLWPEYKRKEQLEFEIREVGRETWKYFSKYHYLSNKLPGGKLYIYGLFQNNNQVGFICYANYTPKRKNQKWIFHMNRLVIHPDYTGLNLGIKLVNKTSDIVIRELNTRVMSKLSSAPVYRAMSKDDKWRLSKVSRDLKVKSLGVAGSNKKSFRTKVKTYSFEYIGDN